MHSPCLLVWLLIMSDDDLIHLFVEDEILERRLQNINVTSLLTESTFTQKLNLYRTKVTFAVTQVKV
jgi:hypothetical protein